MTTVTAFEPMLVLETSEPAREFVPAASPKTRKPRVWTAFATFFVAAIVSQLAVIIAFVVTGFATGIIMGAQGADGATIQTRVQEIFRMPLPALLLSLIPCQLGMIVVVLFAARRSKEPFRQRLGFVPQTGRTFGGFKLAMMACFTVSAALISFLFTTLFMAPPSTNNAIVDVLNKGSWWAITLTSIILSVIPALVEETLFRGYLQRRFLQRWSPAVAIGVSSLLFALMHFDSLQHVIAVVPLGIVTGILAYRTNSIKPGMLLHAVHNSVVVGFGAFAGALTPHMSENKLGALLIGTVAVLGLIGLPAIVSLLRSAKPQASAQTPAASEGVVEPLSVQCRESSLPNFAVDSTLVSQAV
jgi:membrane protease YdiL (CAAX protease family)